MGGVARARQTERREELTVSPDQITYLTEGDKDWTRELRAADTCLKLMKLCGEWKELCPDARAIAIQMTDAEFAEFREGLLVQPAGEPSDRWLLIYSPIAMPAILFTASITAGQFKVPWGCAYIRLEQVKPQWWTDAKAKARGKTPRQPEGTI